MNIKIYTIGLVCLVISVCIALPLLGQSRPAKKTDDTQSAMFDQPMMQGAEKSDSSPAGPVPEKKVEPKKEESLKDLVVTDIVVPITKDELEKQKDLDEEEKEKY